METLSPLLTFCEGNKSTGKGSTPFTGAVDSPNNWTVVRVVDVFMLPEDAIEQNVALPVMTSLQW